MFYPSFPGAFADVAPEVRRPICSSEGIQRIGLLPLTLSYAHKFPLFLLEVVRAMHSIAETIRRESIYPLGMPMPHRTDCLMDHTKAIMYCLMKVFCSLAARVAELVNVGINRFLML